MSKRRTFGFFELAISPSKAVSIWSTEASSRLDTIMAYRLTFEAAFRRLARCCPAVTVSNQGMGRRGIGLLVGQHLAS